ncbi:hypothetical protein DNTS_004481 [Danionella cerebrum]|uniref:P2X purinoceptor n=1 Tax=Danionella cerebrum TaxID=2873325 RepID=A0A553RF03_9TELE|nr:hypothetical protein DNTS_004481 [Danionella translucida]
MSSRSRRVCPAPDLELHIRTLAMAPKAPCLITDFFFYETAKSVVVKSWSVGIINRVLQLLIILYFISWVFVHEKGHQLHDSGVESSVMTKVKGLGKFGNHVMDVADYVFPPQGGSSFSIITNLITTTNQTQGLCPEIGENFQCSSDTTCEIQIGSNFGSGIITGRCLNDSKLRDGSGRCEIQGWCPVEDDTFEGEPMMEVENFTIFIKNSIRFPIFDVTRSNFPSSLNQSNIHSCNYDPEHNPSCPVFKVGDILRHVNKSLHSIIKSGGEIGINISWKCNLDYNVEKCVPRYFFTCLEAAFEGNRVSKGYNFRFAKYFQTEAGIEHRTLYKAFAIHFEVIVSGNAGKFHTVPFLINLVAMYTSVGLATVFCDIILLNFHKGANEYKAKKFEEVLPCFISLTLTLEFRALVSW